MPVIRARMLNAMGLLNTKQPGIGNAPNAHSGLSILKTGRSSKVGDCEGQMQRKFTAMVGKLIEYAYANGYELTFGDAYRDPRSHGRWGLKLGYSAAHSQHKRRMAVDFNLFRDGRYLVRSEDHKELGEYWESIGGTWGGRWNDGNHYSVEYHGYK